LLLDVTPSQEVYVSQRPDSSVHLHLYREGYGLTWAYPASPEDFTAPDDLAAALDDFLRFCNVDPGQTFTTRLVV